MKIVVLSITQYKEKDAIIDAISENGDITFLAKGVLDPKSKNASINNVLSIADIELNEGNYKYPVLKTATQEFNPLKVDNDYYYLSSLLLIAEATKNLLQDEEKEIIFNSLITAIKVLKTSDEPWKILLVYLTKLFKIGGYELEVNRCVFCGNKQGIIAFSFADGGFVCQDCIQDEMPRDLTKTQMLLIRAAVNCQETDKFSYDCAKEDAMVVLEKFFEFIYDFYGIKLKNASLLRK